MSTRANYLPEVQTLKFKFKTSRKLFHIFVTTDPNFKKRIVFYFSFPKIILMLFSITIFMGSVFLFIFYLFLKFYFVFSSSSHYISGVVSSICSVYLRPYLVLLISTIILFLYIIYNSPLLLLN